MKTLKQAVRLRQSVFDSDRRDTVLDLTDLLQGRIDPAGFFKENFITGGMEALFQQAFRRLSGRSANGVIKLTQAMGGGKTHNLIALGLLARHPEVRSNVLRGIYDAGDLGPVRVIGFTGRESDAPYGVWGSLAEQLGKFNDFGDLYSPLRAPGQTAWVKLLQGDPVLVLLDELPPYLVNARSQEIGNSDLASVTTTALANLFVAVGKGELSNVLVVVTDLLAAYGEGSEQMAESFGALRDLQNEADRSALDLVPVQMNTDELYNILRTRLFEDLPGDDVIGEIAQAYAQRVRDARQMDITTASPEAFAQQIRDAYPFHPGVRDLFARFRENPGFQQTRGILRLMRVLLSRMFDDQHGWADKRYLIAPFDIDLNDRETLAEITKVNPNLTNAIGHDVADHGRSVAETMDANRGGTDAQEVAKLLLVASLANVPNATLGLSESEVVQYMCAPERDVAALPKEILGELASARAWYLHQGRDGRLFFKNTQNVVAKLQTIARGFNRESARQELRRRLEAMFQPALRDAYQEVYALPAVDSIDIKPDKVALVLYQPHGSAGLHPDLQALYNSLEYKNRVLFLSGQVESMEALIDAAAEGKAIDTILEEMNADGTAERDPQRQEALRFKDRIAVRLLSAARETFTTLWYPSTNGELRRADFMMQFQDNQYNGEAQVRATLAQKQKFTTDVTGDGFRRKCEQRLFTQQQMLWSEVKRRAATNTLWPWHKPDALDALKRELVARDQWREQGAYVDKGPFPQPKTDVRVQEQSRDDDTGEVTLRVSPVHGDELYYEIGAPATTASGKLENPRSFKTKEMVVSFLCVDSTGDHQTGEPHTWRNRITLKHRIFHGGVSGKMLELRAAPPAAIRYSTDGSDPKSGGGAYDGPFSVPAGTQVVLAVAEKAGIASEVIRIDIDWGTGDWVIDRTKPATWKRRHQLQDTRETYDFIARLRKHNAKAMGTRASVTAGGGQRWLELSAAESVAIAVDPLEKAIGDLRPLLAEDHVDVSLDVSAIRFETGQDLLDWAEEARIQLEADEVEQ